jgi:hypothetical protein
MSELRVPEPALDEPLDIQHDPFPGEDHGVSRRIPHLGHVLLLLGLTLLSLLVSVLFFAAMVHGRPQLRENPVIAVALEALTYVLTLAASYKVFPVLWKRSFARGIEWNNLALRRNWARLLTGGVFLSLLAQFAQRFVNEPKTTDVEQMMRTSAGAWSVMALAVLLAPLVEEIAFRGFLLPAFATAYDWLSLERTPAALQRWSTTTGHSTAAKVFAALLSSLCFALLHAAQNEYAWGVVAVLFGVGMVLAYVRLKTHSVACSTMVHMAYNLTIFILVVAVTHGFRHLERLQR